ncbi:PREDICTED: somatostatin receptor type 5-like [Priapulus caudatus]|uniref:Somatostatin receptor type 5-like n=1 Tax=Priapulus caudatus TaxID=37621 RepID=A0ABM1E7K0_PRICU|nr:PREDICTED: somatostatin receptor type 5-like [Priapulus caudatus]
MVILAIIMLLGTVGNVMVMHVIIVHRRMHTSTNVFIGSLALSDLLFMVGIPFIITTKVTVQWVLGDTLCDIVFFLMFICGSSSILTMMAISFDRWVLVCHPHWHTLTITQALLVAAAMWLMACAISVPLGLAFQVGDFYGPNYLFCTIIWPNGIDGKLYIMVATIFLLVIPTCFIAMNYARIFYTIRLSHKRARGNNAAAMNSSQLRLIKLFVTVVLFFAAMYTPFFILNILLLYTTVPLTSTHYTWCVITCLLNAATNPLLYGYFNENYRRHFREMIACRCSQSDDDSVETPINGETKLDRRSTSAGAPLQLKTSVAL